MKKKIYISWGVQQLEKKNTHNIKYIYKMTSDYVIYFSIKIINDNVSKYYCNVVHISILLLHERVFALLQLRAIMLTDPRRDEVLRKISESLYFNIINYNINNLYIYIYLYNCKTM